MRRAFGAAAVLVLVSLLAACGRRAAPRPNAALASGALRGANVLLVTVDTLRADRVGAYGGGGLTPSLDRLASRGVRFALAHAHAPLTLPAHASILTGLVPARHGVHDNGATLRTGMATLAESLHQAGYRTGAFVGAFVLDRRFGLARGFDVYDDRIAAPSGPIDFAVPRRPADRVTAVAGDWMLGKDADGGAAATPWFCWVHLFDAHAPYRRPEGGAATPYDSAVAFVDGEIGRLLDRLQARSQLNRTLVAVLADHGESLGDHGEATHGLFAYEATLHVPFIVAGPGIAPAVVSAPLRGRGRIPTARSTPGAAPSRSRPTTTTRCST